MHEENFGPGRHELAEPMRGPLEKDPELLPRMAGKSRPGKKRSHDPEKRKALQEELSKMRQQAVETRRKELERTFDLAERCCEMAKDLPKTHIFAFFEEECRVPRNEARRYLELAKVLGPEREMIERSAIDASLAFQILRQPASVRGERRHSSQLYRVT